MHGPTQQVNPNNGNAIYYVDALVSCSVTVDCCGNRDTCCREDGLIGVMSQQLRFYFFGYSNGVNKTSQNQQVLEYELLDRYSKPALQTCHWLDSGHCRATSTLSIIKACQLLVVYLDSLGHTLLICYSPVQLVSVDEEMVKNKRSVYAQEASEGSIFVLFLYLLCVRFRYTRASLLIQ